MDIDFICSVMRLGDGFHNYGNLWENVWWRTDTEYAPITFFVNCNDLFCWASADCETITPENLPNLIKAVEDIREIQNLPKGNYNKYSHDGTEKEKKNWNERFNEWYDSGGLGAILFCARERKMRPQKPYYEQIPEVLHNLFDACGPKRNRKDEG